MSGIRLDVAIAERGLARSRSHARQLIDAGRVTVDGQSAKAGTRVTAANSIEVRADHYVSRGAQKLLHALDAFGIDPTGRRAVDIGASTGGFTQVLIERGAAHVTALDVGHGQFALPGDPRIRVLEGVNVRDVLPGDLDDRIDLVVSDVSFISATFLFAPLRAALPAAHDWVVLVKPQFEVGRERIGDGVVRDAGLRRDAVGTVVEAAAGHALVLADLRRSPIEGAGGNVEYLARFVTACENPTEWTELFDTAEREGA